MKTRVEFEFTDEQVADMVRYCAIRGVLRDNPRKPMNKEEIKFFVRKAVNFMVFDELSKPKAPASQV